VRDYMLLLYAEEGDEAVEAERWAQLPEWLALTEQLRESGVLLGNGPLSATSMATTVRVRGGDTEITDGPFAVTKEVLGGYYLIRCEDLDQALQIAARLPTARYGSVEIRPLRQLQAVSPDPHAGPAEARRNRGRP
jgi:hypothetical protein